MAGTWKKLLVSGDVINADINASAAIAYSKLSIADADLTIAKTSGLQSALDGKSSTAHDHDSDYIGLVATPTIGNFPQLAADGSLVDSSYDETSFATAGHDHSGVYEPADATILKDADIDSTVQGYDADLDAIAALAGTSGLLKKTAANTWALDTSAYLTGNQTITLSGDASGSGTTSIAVTVANDSHTHDTRYFTETEADGRFAALAGSSGQDFNAQNLTVAGDLTVSGTTTTVNTETIALADNIIVLNSNEASAPSQNAGIEVERGTSTNVLFQWNETDDNWTMGDGSKTASVTGCGTGTGLPAYSNFGIGAMYVKTDTEDVYIMTA